MKEKIQKLITELKAKIAEAITAHVAANVAEKEAAEAPTDKAEAAKAKAEDLKSKANAATSAQAQFVNAVKKSINVFCNKPSALTDDDFSLLRELAELAKVKQTAIRRAYRHSNPQRWEEYKHVKKLRKARRRRNRRLRRRQLRAG